MRNPTNPLILNLPIPAQRSDSQRKLYALLAEPEAARAPGVQLRNAADGSEEVLIYDVIDPLWGVSSAAFAEALGRVKGSSVTIRVNSPGGDVFEGRAIANQIRAFRGTTKAVVDGLAASAASTIALAASRVEMASGSFLMVHRSWAFTMGNATDLTDLAALLTKIDDAIAADYAAKAGVPADKALAWMDAETWFTAAEAVDAKLADAAIDVRAQQRAFNLAAFANAPAELLAPVATNDAEQTWAANMRRLRLLG